MGRKYSIAVIGGGNIGTQFACMCASKGHVVNLCSSKPELFDGTLSIVDEFNNIVLGRLNKVTSDIGEAVDGCQIVIVTHPAFNFKNIADRLLPYITKGLCICVVPGTGGAEFLFRECIEAGAVLFGLQRVPSVARLEQYGKRVRCEGLRNELLLGSIPCDKGEEMSLFMQDLWGISCISLPNYLSVTLTPSNSILHTTRLRVLFADYDDGLVYSKNPLFYGEWDDVSSKLLLACDDELQGMLGCMSEMDLRYVRSLKVHYGCHTIHDVTDKLRSIKSLHNLASPMKRADDGWIPDFGSRYFSADFPYGLAIIEAFSSILGFDALNIRGTMSWYRNITGNKSRFDFSEYGVNSIQDLYDFYR